MDDLDLLEDWAAPLLASLSPGERNRLARRIGTALRASQAGRIRKQATPAGDRYVPRKQGGRYQRGAIKRRAMFERLRQSRHLQIRTHPGEVVVGFFGRVARIAQVHQEGLVDAVRPGGPRVRYEARPLLGFTNDDRRQIAELLLDHLSPR